MGDTPTPPLGELYEKEMVFGNVEKFKRRNALELEDENDELSETDKEQIRTVLRRIAEQWKGQIYGLPYIDLEN